MNIKAKTDKRLQQTTMAELLSGTNLAIKIDKAIRIASLSMLSIVKQRVFNNAGGKNSQSKSFGTYNTKYKKVRELKERRTNSQINLMFTGDTEIQFKFGINNGKYCLGFDALPNGDSKNPNASQKTEYMEGRFGDIFALTQEESNQFTAIFLFELDRLIK
jgi:hypothetical protein